MGQINTFNLPDRVPDARQGTRLTFSDGGAGMAGGLGKVAAPQDDLQFTKLSAVLNSLKKGASAMRTQVAHVMTAVRGGTYEVDSLQVSRSIVGESLASR